MVQFKFKAIDKIRKVVDNEKEIPSRFGYRFEDLKRICVYAHFYDKEDVPFYIGQGTISRAFTFTKDVRNKLWLNKVSDISKVHVKILHIDITIEQSIEYEKQYIKQYGRLDLNTGVLTNENDGGINSQIGENNYFFGKKLTGENNGNYGNKYSSNNLSIPVLQIDIFGQIVKEWSSATEAEEIGKFQSGCIGDCCRGKRHIHANYQWIYKKDYKEDIDYSYKPGKTNSKIYIGWNKFDIGDKDKAYVITCKEDSERLGFSHKLICQVANGDKKSHKDCVFFDFFAQDLEFKKEYMDLINLNN